MNKTAIGASSRKALEQRIDQVRATRTRLSAELRSIAEEIPASFTKRQLSRMSDDVDRGVATSELISRYPEHSWLLTIRSSSATAEATVAMLEQSAYQHRLQRKKVRAIAYPLTLMLVAITILLLACVLLVPPFDEMFQEFQLRLPVMTELVIGVSRFVIAAPVQTALIVTTMLVGVAALLWFWIGDGALKCRLLGRSRFGHVTRKPLARMCFQLAELCDEGIELPQGLQIVGDCDHTGILGPALKHLAIEADEAGYSLTRSRTISVVPPNVLFALDCGGRSVAANSGTNTTLMRQLSANYRDVSIHRKEWASFFIGQIAVVSVGVVIGFIVLALFAPLVSLVTSLS